MEDLLQNCYDTIGLIFCIRLVQKYQFIMQKRMIPTMDRHLVKLELLLWPRVKLLLGMHTNSIKRPANPVAGIAAIYGIYKL